MLLLAVASAHVGATITGVDVEPAAGAEVLPRFVVEETGDPVADC